MAIGTGWFKEKGFGRTNFGIELTVNGNKVIGRIFHEIAPNGQQMPPAIITGTVVDGIIQAEKKYEGISHSHIYYKLKKANPANNLYGTFAVHGCPAIDFNCMYELENGEVQITLDHEP